MFQKEAVDIGTGKQGMNSLARSFLQQGGRKTQKFVSSEVCPCQPMLARKSSEAEKRASFHLVLMTGPP